MTKITHDKVTVINSLPWLIEPGFSQGFFLILSQGVFPCHHGLCHLNQNVHLKICYTALWQCLLFNVLNKLNDIEFSKTLFSNKKQNHFVINDKNVMNDNKS